MKIVQLLGKGSQSIRRGAYLYIVSKQRNFHLYLLYISSVRFIRLRQFKLMFHFWQSYLVFLYFLKAYYFRGKAIFIETPKTARIHVITCISSSPIYPRERRYGRIAPIIPIMELLWWVINENIGGKLEK